MGDGNIATGSMPPPPVDCPRAEISPRRSLVGLLPLSRIYSLLIHARACACAWGHGWQLNYIAIISTLLERVFSSLEKVAS